MTNQIKSFVSLVCAGAFLLFVSSCNNDNNISSIDQDLYNIATNTNGYTWYKGTSTYLPKSAGSGHSYPKLRTRYNGIAAQKLDSNQMIIPGSEFPEGSAIVKELANGSNGLERYAILYKDSDNEYADNNGWVWGYIDVDGDVAETAMNKGQACIGCHSQNGNIDYMLMNIYFP